jgi:hypothetical protein
MNVNFAVHSEEMMRAYGIDRGELINLIAWATDHTNTQPYAPVAHYCTRAGRVLFITRTPFGFTMSPEVEINTNQCAAPERQTPYTDLFGAIAQFQKTRDVSERRRQLVLDLEKDLAEARSERDRAESEVFDARAKLSNLVEVWKP